MVAFSANRLVCAATPEIILMISPMRSADCDNSAICALVWLACATAEAATRCDSPACRLISATDDTSWSQAAAADCTLAEDCSDAAATVADSVLVASAVRFRPSAAGSISTQAAQTVPTNPPTGFPKPAGSPHHAYLRR